MLKTNGRKLAILIGLLFVLVLITPGCKVPSSATRLKAPGAGGISSEEYKKIKEAIQLDTISVAPNSAGFMTFYGEVTNDSDRLIRKAEIVVVSTVDEKGGELKRMGVIGKEDVEDLESGETKPFNIVTSLEASDFSGYEVRLEKIEF